MGLVGSGKSLHDGETDFVDSVCEVIDFVGVVVVEDYSESTGCDTEGGVDKSLGDTGGEFGGVRSTGLGQSLEGFDHTHYSTEQTDESTEGCHGSDDGEVLLESRHFESGSFFYLLLESSDFLFFCEDGVGVHFGVFHQSAVDNGSNGTFLFGAEGTSSGDVVTFESGFDTCNEACDVSFAFGGAEGDAAFNGENDNCEEEGLEHRHDETAFVYSTPEVLRMTVFVEVNGVAEPEDEEAYGDDSADYDDPGSIFDAGALLFFLAALIGLVAGF